MLLWKTLDPILSEIDVIKFGNLSSLDIWTL